MKAGTNTSKLRVLLARRSSVATVALCVGSLYLFARQLYVVNYCAVQVQGYLSDQGETMTMHQYDHHHHQFHQNWIPQLPPLIFPIPHPRYFFGIFTFDGEQEAEMRQAIRTTYFSKNYNNQQTQTLGTNTVCSLAEILSNNSLAQDESTCRIIFSFVAAGGDPKQKPTVCYWPTCATGTSDFLLPPGKDPYNMSRALRNEQARYKDFCFLAIQENPNEGKSETFFSFAVILSIERPDLRIGFIGKLDTDTLFFANDFVNDFVDNATVRRRRMLQHPFIYAGWEITREVCSQVSMNRVCANDGFHAPLFMPGGFYFLSQPLARHAFLDGLSREEKESAHFPHHEDMSIANIVFLRPPVGNNITTVRIAFLPPASHSKTVPNNFFALHPIKNPGAFISNYTERFN